MTIKILCFGITRDLLGGASVELDMAEPLNVANLKKRLKEKCAPLAELSSLQIAINQEYAEDIDQFTATDEIVLIPPVSGG